MSIAVADNFQYKGGKPLDARMKFATILDMTAAQVADLYDGCFSYVVAEKKYYSYDSNNENDPHLGKWREYSAGAKYSDFTGATSQDAGAHGLVPAPTTADVDKYLKGDGSWGAIEMPNFDYSNEFGAENIYSTTEKMIGQWMDGKPLYQKTFYRTVVSTENGVWVELGNADSNMDIKYYKSLLKTNTGAFMFKDDNIVGSGYQDQNMWHSAIVKIEDNKLKLYVAFIQSSSASFPATYCITLQYTKTTDSAMSIGTPNDYSTTEKIVGQWIDGNPLYQKTYSLNTVLPAANASPRSVNITLDGLSSIGIDNIIDMSIVAKGRDNYAGSWLNRGCGENLSGYISVNENKLQVFQKQTNDSNQFTVTSCTIWYTKTT